MIEFLDGAMAAYLNQMLNAFVIWSPPELARKNLARLSQERNRNDLGMPGISVFRTGCPKYSDVSFEQTLGSLGWPAGKTAAGDFAILKAVPVQAEYTIQIWCQELSDLNKIERDLSFLDIGNPVYAKIRCRNYEDEKVEIPLHFAADHDDPTYQYEPEEQTGKLLYFGLQTKFYVDCQWVKSDIIYRIEQINVLYQELLTETELDFVEITVDSLAH